VGQKRKRRKRQPGNLWDKLYSEINGTEVRFDKKKIKKNGEIASLTSMTFQNRATARTTQGKNLVVERLVENFNVMGRSQVCDHELHERKERRMHR